jgi:EmrB/QacA subfamily drug resistance transporter
LPLGVLVIGSFMSVLDTSIVNVAIPHMQSDLSASVDGIEWVVTAYTLALGVVVPATAWLGSRIGQARLYVVAMLGFAGASALCGLAWSLGAMITFRVLQALPGGVLPVVTLTMLYQVVPRERIGAAMGIYGLGIVVAPAVGPTLGGWLVDDVDWRLIFYINTPIGLLGALAAALTLPWARPTSWPRFDLWGFVAVAYGLFALLLAFSEGEKWGWTGYRILALFVSSALSLALFVVIEREVDQPLIELRIFACRPYWISLLLLAIAMTGLFTTLYYIPQYLQNIHGLQALDSGLTLVPSALVTLVLMPVAGRIYDAVGPRWPVMIGMVVMAAGSYLLAQLTPGTPLRDVALWTSIRNLGTGLAMMPIITAGVSALPNALTSAGSAMNNVVQRVVSSVAIAAFGSLNTTTGAQIAANWSALYDSGPQTPPEIQQAQTHGPSGLLPLYQEFSARVTTQTYDNGFYLVALLCVAGAALSLLMRSDQPDRSTGSAA